MEKIKTVSLNEIYKIAYRGLPLSIRKEQTLEKYRQNNKKQLNEICREIGIDLLDFGNSNININEDLYSERAYEIPIILVPLLITLLKSGKKKGSYVNLLKNNKYDEISLEQKLEFIKAYEKELYNIKNYSDISNDEIKKAIDNLKNKAELADRVRKFVESVDSGVLSTIRRDLYNINKVDEYSMVALPYLGWIRDYVKGFFDINNVMSQDFWGDGCPHRDSVPECSNMLCKKRIPYADNPCIKCLLRDCCNKCRLYAECSNNSKTNPFFDSVIREHERVHFTEIYIGMIKKAHERFYDFLSEYKEVVDLNSMSKALPYDEDVVKAHISEVLFNSESQFEKHVISDVLNTLENNGVVRNK